MKDTLMKLLLVVLPALMNMVSPEIRKMYEEFMLRCWEKAKATPNPVDDVVVEFIAKLTKVDLPE